MKTVQRFLLAAVGAFLALGLVAAPAMAAEVPQPTPQTPVPHDGKQDNYHGCSVVAGPNYLGLSCGGQTSSQLQVFIHNHKKSIPDCWWDEPLTPEELEAVGRHNVAGDDGYAWYWERCLKGVDKKTGDIGPNGVSIETGLHKVMNGDKPKTIKNAWKNRLPITGTHNGVPAPFAAAAPNPNPLVYSWMVFYNPFSDDVKVEMQGVLLRAVNTHTEVKPLGANNDAVVSCPNGGVRVKARELPPQTVEKPTTHPEACWWRYRHSSADQQDEVYHVPMTSHWKVYVSFNGGGEELFTEFDKTAVTRLSVREIQAVVVY